MSLLLIAVIVLIGFLFLSLSPLPVFTNKNMELGIPKTTQKDRISEQLKTKALTLKAYATKNNMDTSVCFLINMNISSGENRFFVYDLKALTISDKGLVTHGRCNERFLIGRKYGNTVGCGCTSLGKYKIGRRYQGKFGLAYKLHGLDKSNNNAFKRFVVLHSHDCVPYSETLVPVCQSDGCPTVAPDYLVRLSSIIDKSDRPVLMEIFDE